MTASTSPTKRAELAAFLRDRRGRISPADVGLPNGARRRTPGLRREEVALLADVGASWYTWLEQGRDIQVSEALLERLSRALRLDATERSYLFDLAQGRAPRPVASVVPNGVSPMLLRALEAHRHPATVATARYDVLAMNAAAIAVWGDLRGENSLRRMFTGDIAPFSTPEREAHARNLVARYRVEAGRATDRTSFDELAAELVEQSPEFRLLWGQHDIIATPEGTKIVDVPHVGRIEMEHVALLHVEPDGRVLRLTLYAPLGEESATRLAKAITPRT